LRRIEVTSFVSPRWVPQLADAKEVYQAIEKGAGVVYSALIPNDFGLERALEVGVQQVAVFTAASETFNQHNINASVAESLSRFEPVCRRAASMGLSVRGYVSTSFGCPYEGDVAPEAVADVVDALEQLGIEEISLGDTNGIAVPSRVGAVLEAVSKRVSLDRIAVHFHDTNGRALANVYAALEAGVCIVDASAGGLGGCPYSPGASGNLATEDLISMLDGMGIESGVSLEKVCEASSYMEKVLNRELPSRVLKAIRCARS